jgi:hypothetical protein
MLANPPMNHVAQISNLLCRRFPIGRLAIQLTQWSNRKARRLEALRHSRLEIFATVAAFNRPPRQLSAGDVLAGPSLPESA